MSLEVAILGHFVTFNPFPQVDGSIWWAKITSGHPISVLIFPCLRAPWVRFVSSPPQLQITGLGVVCRGWAWEGKSNLFPKKILLPKIFSTKIFTSKIFTSKIFLPNTFFKKIFLVKIFFFQNIFGNNILLKKIFEKIFF